MQSETTKKVYELEASEAEAHKSINSIVVIGSHLAILKRNGQISEMDYNFFLTHLSNCETFTYGIFNQIVEVNKDFLTYDRKRKIKKITNEKS